MTDENTLPAEASQFDFLLGEWRVKNRMRHPDGSWHESEASYHSSKMLNDTAILEYFSGTVRDKQIDAVGLRSFDPATGEWSILWVDNGWFRMDIAVGKFEGDIGHFYVDVPASNGTTVRQRYRWSDIKEDSSHWELAVSRDDGENWDTVWTMDFEKSGV